MGRLLLLLPLCLLLAPEFPRRPRLPRATVRAAAPAAPQMERLAASDPVAFLEACVARYDREVTSYTTLLVKQERIAGTLQPEEWMRCWFREKPTFRVLMQWERGQRLAHRTLYVEGQNDGLLLVKPTGLLGRAGTARRAPDSADAKSSARYPANEFGIQAGTRRTLAGWRAARDLKVTFGGLKTPPELGYPCWQMVRPDYTPEGDGVAHSTYYIDPATWLQVGSVLKDADGKVIGRYYFTELKLNAEIADDTFTEKGLWR
ncbi:MAG: DUF1571 domain-containing protein [Gemmataceae bacterium]